MTENLILLYVSGEIGWAEYLRRLANGERK